MVVVDTNVLAYLLMDGSPSAAARALYARDADWHSEPLILVELSNVLATEVRVRGYPLDQALATLAEATRRIEPGLHAVADADALAAAARFGITAYDARFVMVARGLDARLVTEDARLRKAAPTLTCSLAEALVA